MDIILIAAVTLDGYIARTKEDRVEWSQDLPLFKKQTMGFPLIMGSTTRKILQKELEGREIITVHRNDNPREILSKIKGNRCFIAGGGTTYTRFAPHLTHLYLTFHPLIFGEGIKLFPGLENPLDLELIERMPIPRRGKLYQYQYRVLR